jgi:hypothetical protein
MKTKLDVDLTQARLTIFQPTCEHPPRLDREAQAHKGSHALEVLADDNSIAVNAASVVTRDPDNEFEHEIAAIQADLAQTRAEHAASRAERKKRLRRELIRSVGSFITCLSARADSPEIDVHCKVFQQEERKS